MARKPLVDPTTAAHRWGRKDPGRAYALEVCEHLLKHELLTALWDSLNTPAGRALPIADRCRLARRALEIIATKDPESTAAAQARVLLDLLPARSSRHQNRLDPAVRAAAHEAIKRTPTITTGQLHERFGVSKTTASKLKDEVAGKRTPVD